MLLLSRNPVQLGVLNGERWTGQGEDKAFEVLRSEVLEGQQGRIGHWNRRRYRGGWLVQPPRNAGRYRFAAGLLGYGEARSSRRLPAALLNGYRSMFRLGDAHTARRWWGRRAGGC